MVSLEDLGLSAKHKPSEKVYKKLAKLSKFMIENVLKDSFEMYGTENLREDHYQMFLCDHKFYTDPILCQMAVVLSSGNDKPIPAPAYKTYVKSKTLGPVMIKLFSYPIYGKEDGYDDREKSIQYSVECFLKQERILVFPEGKIAHDGLLDEGKLGSAEIAWRAYHKIQEDEALRNKKKGLKIIPMEVSYYPVAGIPWKQMKKMTVRFGEPFDFEKEVVQKIRNYYGPRFNNNEKIRKRIMSRLMSKVMKSIGYMTAVNMDNVLSEMLYEHARKGEYTVNKGTIEKKLEEIVTDLSLSENLYLLDHFKNEHEMKKAFEDFLKRCKKKEIIEEYSYPAGDSAILLDLKYISSKPEFKKVRSENIILYNHNLMQHSEEFKRIMIERLRKQ